MKDDTTYYAHGKLLLTAEYFVLDGAMALALPVKYGQSFTVSKHEKDNHLHWQSFDEKGHCWFEAIFQKDDFGIIEQNNEAIANRLQTIFKKIKGYKPQLKTQNLKLKTHLTFPKNWGLGTSSTLIYLLAKWAGVDPFQLQLDTFGGSGYDIACAGATEPILYKKENGLPIIEAYSFAPSFSDNLYFIYLGKKQNSREGIERYREKKKEKREKRSLINEVSDLTHSFLKEKQLSGFEKLIIEHEKLVGHFIGLPRAKDLYFKKYWGEIKSLGAWGGDFVLATSDRTEKETRQYFNEKGFDVFIPYKEMVK